MIRYQEKNGSADQPAAVANEDEFIAPAPRVSVQAFCETVETASIIQAGAEDRRLAKVHLRMQMGGIAAALEAYRTSPTPNVVILESENRGEDILAGLDQLADHLIAHHTSAAPGTATGAARVPPAPEWIMTYPARSRYPCHRRDLRIPIRGPVTPGRCPYRKNV